MMDALTPMLFGLFALVGVCVAVALGLLPWWIAKSRGHQSAAAILVCGLVGMVIWPAWIVALVWAFAGQDHAAAKASVRRPDLIQSMYGAAPSPPPSVRSIDAELDIGRAGR